MKIGEAAKKTGLTVSNIRFYEKKGLLRPKRKEDSQYREFEEEDIRRLKEIILLRKTGLSVESIYLLYEGQAEFSVLLHRQEEELSEQIERLEGSQKLCRRLEKEKGLTDLDVDSWLSCVREEEAEGEKYAAVEELLEDLAESTRLASFRGDPYIGRYFSNHWTARVLALMMMLSLLAAAFTSVLSGGGILGSAVILFWLIYLGAFVLDFLRFRKQKKKKEETE